MVTARPGLESDKLNSPSLWPCGRGVAPPTHTGPGQWHSSYKLGKGGALTHLRGAVGGGDPCPCGGHGAASVPPAFLCHGALRPHVHMACCFWEAAMMPR